MSSISCTRVDTETARRALSTILQCRYRQLAHCIGICNEQASLSISTVAVSQRDVTVKRLGAGKDGVAVADEQGAGTLELSLELLASSEPLRWLMGRRAHSVLPQWRQQPCAGLDCRRPMSLATRLRVLDYAHCNAARELSVFSSFPLT